MSRVDRPPVEELLKVTTAESPWGMADSDAADLCNYILRLEADLAASSYVSVPLNIDGKNYAIVDADELTSLRADLAEAVRVMDYLLNGTDAIYEVRAKAAAAFGQPQMTNRIAESKADLVERVKDALLHRNTVEDAAAAVIPIILNAAADVAERPEDYGWKPTGRELKSVFIAHTIRQLAPQP